MRMKRRHSWIIICCLSLLASTASACTILSPQTTVVPPITSTTTTILPTASQTTGIPPTTSATITPTYEPVQTYSNPQTYHAVRTLTITNESADIQSFRVWLPVATAWDSQTNVVLGENTPYPGTLWQDPQYATKGSFIETSNNPAAGSSLTITDEFTFTCYEINYNIDPTQIQAYDKTDAQYILYTQPENYIEADDPVIIKTASEIRGTQNNPYEIAQSIYKWVMGHMTYQMVGGLKGAKFAYENGYGECGDYSCLFSALCRASGIPARPIVGRWATSVKNDWHVWAEFYLPGYGWVPVDPTIEDNSGGNYFGHIDNKRLIFNKQCNVVLEPSPLFFSASCSILQTWFGEYKGAAGTISTDMDYTIVPIPGN